MSRVVFYNFAPPDKARQSPVLNRELAGLCREFRPRLLAGCEAIGWRLDPLPGYAMIRDRTRSGRANLVAFVREDVLIRRHWWWDGVVTWPRTEHTGTHPARSGMVLGLGSSQWGVGHQPPQGTVNTQAGQLEGIDAWTRTLVPWRHGGLPAKVSALDLEAIRSRPRAVLADWNRRPGEDGPGPDYLAHRISGQVHGDAIDAMVARRLSVESVDYVTHAAGVPLGTDHPRGALVVTLAAGAVRWGGVGL